MQRVYNYGSFLQAFALKKTIEALGNKCEFLDIKSGVQLPCHTDTENATRGNKLFRILRKTDKYLLKRIENHFFRKNFVKRYENEFFKILNLPEKPCYEKKFDGVVIGSDEVFNCLQKSSWGFTDQLFGKGINADKIITYAASFGSTRLEDLVKNNLCDPIQSALTNISEISVRDQNSFDIINQLTGIPPLKHVDPVMIFDFNEYIPDHIKFKNYILVYAYTDRINDPEEVTAILNFAKKNNKKVIAVSMFQLFCEKNFISSPFELLRFVKNADYIITDTFHGTIFSIKYHKKFCTFIRDSNSEKISDLLDTFNLGERSIKSTDGLEKVLYTPINYDLVNNHIECQKDRTLEYLRKHLKPKSILKS
jgi:hypothetical protein